MDKYTGKERAEISTVVYRINIEFTVEYYSSGLVPTQFVNLSDDVKHVPLYLLSLEFASVVGLICDSLAL
ncbi:hypothetical protein GWI33_008749 [Rhynchophorus ferrugineus]|uniref:Uncharacterized protein n=1 Tax=Rhynchophorus ferrugineus TaxID=354439 RepID=A0A834MDX2_RHYFE|nr:hypothetical protein GWI33_008749 [Rhynchophorus ferrugineus]